MKQVKHIFFDLDHTLWDFEANSKEALIEILHELNLLTKGLKAEDFIEKYKQINAYYWHQYQNGKIEKEKLRFIRFQDTLHYFEIYDEEVGNQFGKRYLEISPRKQNLIKGTVEILNYLKPHYKLHIITNGFQEVQFIKMDQSKLTNYFDSITCSEEISAKKPDPEVFLHALKKQGASPQESVMIGDDFAADVLGAKAVDMKTIYFNPLGNDQNYKYHIHSLEELKNYFKKASS